MPKNEMPEIQSLEPVKSLWEVWPNEAHDFTPWLIEHIHRLEATLNFNLKEVEREKTLSGAGRVDIYGLQVGSDAIVVIENQLGMSDDSHCLRLMGYASKSEASILVWVAREFTSYHQGILRWLNEADNIDVYAVAVRAYRVGEAMVADFQTVVEPNQSRGVATPSTGKTKSTLCAEFYRPLVERLRRVGIYTVGKGGWRGRYRSFQSGLDGAVYGTRVEDGMAQVFLCIGWGRYQERFNALQQHRKEIDSEIEGTVYWMNEGEYSWEGFWHLVLENRGSFSLTATEEELETIRQWVADNIVSLRDVLQPYLDQLRQNENALSDKDD